MIRALLLGLIGAASFAAVYLLMDPRGAGESGPASAPRALSPPTDPPPTSLPAATAAIGFELRPAAEPAAPATAAPERVVRDVTPNNMTAGPQVTGTLSRVDPPVEAAKPRSERLFNPIVLAAGTIKARDREIRIAGVAAPEFDARCGEGSAAWPCGRMARAALRSFIRGRAIECGVPAGATAIPDPAECVVGGASISEWLVAHGWAKRSGDLFEAAEKTAREAKAGLWGDGRPDLQAAEVASGG